MKKTIIYLIFTAVSFCSFSQWKIENYDDGFEKTSSIHTNFYQNIGKGCTQKSCLAMAGKTLYLVTDCFTGDKSDRWYIDVIMTIDGIEKKYLFASRGALLYVVDILDKNRLLKMEGFFEDEEILNAFLNATNIKVKASGPTYYDVIYFELKLNPSNTEQAWDANTGGKYLSEKKAKQEEMDRKKREEEERIKLENQKKELDKITLQKINDLLSKNAVEEATKEYSKLNFESSEMKSVIQKKLDAKYGSEEMILIDQKLNDYIINNSIYLIEKEPKIHNLKFDKNGRCSDYKLPNLDNVPVDRFGNFFVYKNSKAELKIELKDSILVSSTYSTSYTKPLFIDKNENFYYKTKTGLPVASISNNPSVDKKLIRINKVLKREKYANGILIDSQEFKTEKTIGIMKKDQ